MDVNPNGTAVDHRQVNAKPRGRQIGQRVVSLDYRAYKALRDFPFEYYIEGHYNSEELIEALIARLRERGIF